MVLDANGSPGHLFLLPRPYKFILYTPLDVAVATWDWYDPVGSDDDPAGWYNAEEFGVVADDTTDQSAALQEAIDAVIAAGGGVLRLPAGVMRFGTPLTTNGAGAGADVFLTIEGAGRDGTQLVWDGASSAYPLSLGGTGASLYNGYTARGFRLVHNTAMSGGAGLRIRRASNVVLDDIEVRGAVDVIHVGDDTYADDVGNIEVRNLYCQGIGRHVFGLYSGSRLTVLGGFFNGSNQYGSTIIAALSATRNFDGVKMTGVTAEEWQAVCVCSNTNGISNVKVFGNIFDRAVSTSFIAAPGAGGRCQGWQIFGNNISARTHNHAGTAQAGSSTSITLASGGGASISAGMYVRTTGGTGAGQFKEIVSVVGDTCTINGTFSTPPNGTTTYQVAANNNAILVTEANGGVCNDIQFNGNQCANFSGYAVDFESGSADVQAVGNTLRSCGWWYVQPGAIHVGATGVDPVIQGNRYSYVSGDLPAFAAEPTELVQLPAALALSDKIGGNDGASFPVQIGYWTQANVPQNQGHTRPAWPNGVGTGVGYRANKSGRVVAFQVDLNESVGGGTLASGLWKDGSDVSGTAQVQITSGRAAIAKYGSADAGFADRRFTASNYLELGIFTTNPFTPNGSADVAASMWVRFD